MIKFLQKSEFGGPEERKVILWAAITAIILAILDQSSKAVVVSEFTLGESVTVIPGFFNLTYITNKGAAWGILHGKIWLLMLISTVVFVLIVWQIRTLTEGWNERCFAMALIVSGIIGNSIDRIWRKEVVDFLDFYISINDKNYSWPAFNVADSAITVGVIIYIASTLFRKSPDKSDVQAEDPNPAE